MINVINVFVPRAALSQTKSRISKKDFMKLQSARELVDINNWNMIIAAILLLLLGATAFIQQIASAEEEPIGSTNASLAASSNKTQLISFVESALSYAEEHGKDEALIEFSNKTGTFVQGDLYIYAYDFNGTCLAHPFRPEWIGKNKLDVMDSNGVPSLRNTLNVAREGKGFTSLHLPESCA